eukprot:CAMPEP_0176115846 /NCGR_PEP_ID=MMETSP0120_2-20121206/58177_1 /TAXON_ID=160619 /ORGANISM="Kryptoperidinium foliaceum, Strain CCMP 1326" /LENGTH=169 /DNA_ID=CAMNT_0017450087 /DNA_START=140 /DNA_END=646 /DNA_ORIENTATION=+
MKSFSFLLFLAFGTLLTPSTGYTFQHKRLAPSQTTPDSQNRRKFLQQSLSIAFGVGALSTPAFAAEEVALPSKATVASTFDAIRYELENPEGGVSYMQKRIDEQDWAGLMEFTKTYDLELRKLRMGKAKKLLQSKEIKETATGYANAVTFDLIGINRNSRKGQENQENA